VCVVSYFAILNFDSFCLLHATDLTVLFFIKKLNVLYMSITGTFKVALIIVLSVIFFDETIGTVNAIGITITMLAFSADSYLTYLEKMEATDIEREPLLSSPQQQHQHSRHGEQTQRTGVTLNSREPIDSDRDSVDNDLKT
jgi:hypothetical protein